MKSAQFGGYSVLIRYLILTKKRRSVSFYLSFTTKRVVYSSCFADYLPGRPLRSRRETTIQHHLKVKTETVSQQELFLGRARFHRYAAKFTRLHVQARSKRVERGEAANPTS